jgi:hypothetical protein
VVLKQTVTSFEIVCLRYVQPLHHILYIEYKKLTIYITRTCSITVNLILENRTRLF